jgi:hypothetical protein
LKVKNRKLREKAKRDDNTEVTEIRTQRTQRAQRKKEKKQRDKEAKRREPKTHPHKTRVGYPKPREGNEVRGWKVRRR